MNLPNNSNKEDLPDDARGNPAYEQTRQDMPLWCCGTNCGRNARVACVVLSLVGIGASTFSVFSPNYFSFVSLRNDTYYDEDKMQPEPFQYATEANVGLFKYEILDVYRYPWPPKQEFPGSRWLQTDEADLNLDGTASDAPTQATMSPSALPSALPSAASALPSAVPSALPSTAPSSSVPSAIPSATPTASDVPSSEPSTVAPSIPPTGQPTSAPTISNPNDIVDATTQLNTVLEYEKGREQFDSGFSKAQLGSFMAPIFAGVGTVFGLMEMCCCVYKCSWLPTAIFLYLAFTFQGFTLFLFLSEDFCKYAQECSLGLAGVTSVLAIICYIISNILICMTPRPDPCFNLCKKPPVKRKKKKKKKKDPEQDELNPTSPPVFRDEDEGYVDPYAEDDFDDEYYSDEDDDEYEYDESYIPPDTRDNTMDDDDVYNEQDEDVYNDDPEGYDEAIGYDEDDSYAAETFGGDTHGQDIYGNDTQMTDGGWSSGDEDSEMGAKQFT